MKKWKLLHRMVHLESPWITVFADRMLDNRGKELEYWHFERADSVIVLAMQGDHFVLPDMEYRPGVDAVTLDFVGGRIGPGKTPREAAISMLDKELGVSEQHILDISPLAEYPFAVDSSFSSQQVYGFVARIAQEAPLAASVRRHLVTNADQLQQELRCAQCRLMLNEFLLCQKSR